MKKTGSVFFENSLISHYMVFSITAAPHLIYDLDFKIVVF